MNFSNSRLFLFEFFMKFIKNFLFFIDFRVFFFVKLESLIYAFCRVIWSKFFKGNFI